MRIGDVRASLASLSTLRLIVALNMRSCLFRWAGVKGTELKKGIAYRTLNMM